MWIMLTEQAGEETNGLEETDGVAGDKMCSGNLPAQTKEGQRRKESDKLMQTRGIRVRKEDE